jgi:hypothetical protein
LIENIFGAFDCVKLGAPRTSDIPITNCLTYQMTKVKTLCEIEQGILAQHDYRTALTLVLSKMAFPSGRSRFHRDTPM